MNATATAPLAYAARPPARAANDDEGAIIDLFAGGGGASEAIFEETGRHPDLAVNHDPEALALHEANHPATKHLCDDIRQVDVEKEVKALGYSHVALLWASPDCKDHSKAKGGKPKDKNIRGLAWEVLRWSAAIRRATGRLPRMIALENVEEFQDWGPLHTQGRRAGTVQKRRRKETFNLWVQNLRSLGFHDIEWREVVAADYGAPTTRKRLFLIARSDGAAIAWPAPTHMPAAKMQGDLFDLLPYRSAASIIDWSLPIPSIFGRRKELKPKTRARIAKGIRRYVIESARPFLVKVTHTSSTDMAADSAEPLQTLTTAKGGEFAAVAPSVMPVNHGGGENRVYDPQDPLRTATAAPRGEHAVSAPLLVPRYGERPGQDPRTLDIQAPYPTVVPDGNGGQLVGAHLLRTDMQSAYQRNGVHNPEEPVRTITSGGGFAVAGTTLGAASIGVGGRAGQSPPRGVDQPLHTVTAKGDRAVTAAYLGRQFGSTVSGRDLEEPHPAVMTDGAGGKSQVVAAHLGRQFGRSVGSEAADPVGVVTPGGGGKTTVQIAFMAQHNGDRVGRPAEDPLTTTVHRGTQQQVVAPVVDKYYGAGVAADATDPLDTATAKARFGLAGAFLEQANTGMVGHDARQPVSTIVGAGSTQRLVDAVLAEAGAEGGRRREVLEFLWEHFGAPTAEEIADPLATPQGRLRFGLVVIGDVVWAIVDIGMRMLTPRELYSAQGFSPAYRIDIEFRGKPLTKTAQTRMTGNSVSPPPARALLRANLPRQMLRRAA